MSPNENETSTSAASEKPKEMIKLTLADGTVLELDKSSRVYASLRNLEEEQKTAVFADSRTKFEDAVTKIIQSQTKGFEGALEGMSLVLDFATEDGAKLHETSKITIRQRAKRSDAAS